VKNKVIKNMYLQILEATTDNASFTYFGFPGFKQE